MNTKRVFLIILDSFGVGELPDAHEYGDTGSSTLKAIQKSPKFNTPVLNSLGLFNIDGVGCGKPVANPKASFAKMAEISKGKDTTIGHWEISGIISETKLPTYPNGFPEDVIEKFQKATGRKVLCNLPYSGTKVLEDYGNEHLETGDLIVYTSADSVFQIAAHEELVPIETLYEYCKMAREIMCNEHAVARIIARPFVGKTKETFKRTTNRHDYSLSPPSETFLNVLNKNGLDTIGVGKISDIFNGECITKSYPSKGNTDGMNITLSLQEDDFNGLCFVNLVDFDMLYGHRNDIDGYANAATVLTQS